MHVELTIKNYRCFPDSNPLHFEIREGFTAFVGVNNSGKSSILRFLYEFRNLFAQLRDPNGLLNLLRGSRNGLPLASSIKDTTEIFCDSNDRDLILEFTFPSPPLSGPSTVSIQVKRDSAEYSLSSFSAGHDRYEADNAYVSLNSRFLISAPGRNLSVDFGEFADVMNVLN
jgi:hypothetical protein